MIEQNAFTIIFGVFVLFSCRDVFIGSAGHDAEQNLGKPTGDPLHHHHHHHSGIRSMGSDDTEHLSSLPGITTLKIQFCQSCGYRQAFEEISKVVQNTFPEIKVEGEVHRPDFLRSTIVNLLFVAKIAVLAMLYMEFNPFTYFQMETPGIWTYMLSNKISSTLMVFFISNTIEGNLMSTGAFEIFYNDMPVWSKIQTGRMPTGPELMQIIQSHRSFVPKSPIVGEFTST